MPNCFQLIKNGEAVDLNAVDEELCQHFGEEVHPVRYFEAWFDCVGSLLAAGRSFDEVRSAYKDVPRLVGVVDYLEKNFTVRSWYERKGHERPC